MSSDWSQRALKWSTHGATAAVATKLFNPDAGSIELSILGGKRINLSVAAFGMGVAASALSDSLHQWVLPYVSADERMKHMESAIVTPAAGAAAFTGVMWVSQPDVLKEDGQLSKLMITGAASELVAQYIYENFVVPATAKDYHDSA